MAFCFCRKDPQTGMILPEPKALIITPAHLRDPNDKDDFADFVKDVLKSGNGMAVLTVMECWIAGNTRSDTKSEAEAEAAMKWEEHGGIHRGVP